MVTTEKSMRTRPKPDIVFAVMTVVLAAVFLTAINYQPWISSQTSDSMGTGFVPRLGVYIVVLGAVILLLEAWRLPLGDRTRGAAGEGRLRDYAYPAIVAAVYIYGVYNIGFVVVTMVMFPIYLYGSGIRKLRVLVPVSIGGTLIMYIFFMRMLSLFFPRARFF